MAFLMTAEFGRRCASRGAGTANAIGRDARRFRRGGDDLCTSHGPVAVEHGSAAF